MALRIVRLGTPRAPDEGLRLGTVRRPPRGVPKAQLATRDFYDVWVPEAAPSEALRVFSDEMRDRRLLRAEERANQLPVKMVAPLGIFIFPVILMTVLVPILLRLASILPN